MSSVYTPISLLYFYQWKQESWAITKMTSRCALHIGALKIFKSSWVRLWLLFLKFLTGICSDRSYECAQNLKFVALPLPELIGSIQKLGSPWISPCSLFSEIFNGLLFGRTLWMYRPKLVLCFSHSWDNSDWNFGLGLQTPNLRKEEAVWGRGLGDSTIRKIHRRARCWQDRGRGVRGRQTCAASRTGQCWLQQQADKKQISSQVPRLIT